MKILKIFLLSLLFWLQYSLWLGKNGVLDFIKIYRRVTIEKKIMNILICVIIK
ncbi:hypothetical protein CWU_02725 [Buchnera aphidicola str. JF98 (Acyrthosiphon pisum)]|nr:hypothetical protein CWU_02725 [Buchnera aphidicola str. JF98 (Acyrthosiphon pisum)]